MKNQKHTINYIKRQAKSLKKDRGISHTDALEMLSKDHGYSNWQHCVKSLTQETRKVVIVNNVTSIHYLKRTVEKFIPGDEAWISWDGKKAVPVKVTEVDGPYYSFKIEAPQNKAGNEHYLRLDEVRSTPELACINCVTS